MMKEDGSIKTSEDKTRVIIGDRVTAKPNTLGNPSGLRSLRSRVTSESLYVHQLPGGKSGPGEGDEEEASLATGAENLMSSDS